MKKSNEKPIAHLICGFIGAGKTTFSKKLQKETRALRFTKDEWIIKIFGNDPSSIDQFDKYDERVKELSFDVAFECLKAGNDIIIDDGLWIRGDRNKMRKRVEKVGATPVFYYLKCSFDTMKKRTLNRNKKTSKDTFNIDEKMFESYKKYFEEFGDDEQHIVINTEMDKVT